MLAETGRRSFPREDMWANHPFVPRKPVAQVDGSEVGVPGGDGVRVDVVTLDGVLDDRGVDSAVSEQA